MGAQKALMNIVGKNIANANTPGYSRQRLGITSSHIEGTAIDVGTIKSVRAMQIQKSLLGSAQGYGFQNAKVSVLQLAEPGLNDLDGVGVSAAMEGFFTAIGGLAGNPVGSAERESVLGKASALATAIKTAAVSLSDAQNAAEKEASLVASDINSMTKEIANLNKSIAMAQANPGSAEDLVDQRNLLLKKLAGQVDVQVVSKDDGSVSVFMGSGRALVLGDSSNVVAVAGGGSDPLSLTVSSPGGDPVGSATIPGGRIGGLFTARDVTLAKAVTELDQMAFDLASKVNGVHKSGFGLDGSTGVELFAEPLAVKGAASQLALSADIVGHPEKLAAALDADMLPGDDANIQALLDIGVDKVVAGETKTLSGAWDGVVAAVAHGLSDAMAQSEAQANRLNHFEAIDLSESGVALHEEMTMLTQAERAFQAVSKVIATANQLYDTVLRMV